MKAIDDITAAADREVKARPWLDHLVRAYQRFSDQRGDFFAAGITYFTVLALFPLLMVAFSVAGFMLAGDPELLARAQREITDLIPGSMGTQLNELVDHAIDSRASVGVLGLLGAAYAGLGWMANLRAALTAQWDRQHPDDDWWKTKLSDLWALVALGLAFVVSVGISVGGELAPKVLELAGVEDAPGAHVVLRVLSLMLGLAASWLMFTWIITRLPREPVTFTSALRAGLMAAAVFEVFKQLASFYLRSVLNSPAGVVFGPIIGIMVFSYMSYRILLFATAWAATARENLATQPVAPPDPVVIQPRPVAPGAAGKVWPAVFGAVAAVSVVRLLRAWR